jgi:hypothetical protein
VLVSDSDSGQLIYGEVHNVTLNGLALMAWVDKGQYWPESDTSAELFARVRDESGALVRGLAGSFSVTVDGQPPSLAFSEPENGSYTATLPLADLRIGEHVLKLTCEDARGLRTSESLTFAYGEEYLVYLPLVLRQ